MNDDLAFARAVQTAREHIPIVKKGIREECRVGFTIVRDGDQYRVYNQDAWIRPTGNLLPWSPPRGEPVADVALDGTVTFKAKPQKVIE